MNRRIFLGMGALLGAFTVTGLAACTDDDDTPDYRYRLTVEVDTPDGLKTGSSVIEVQTDVAGERAITSPGRVNLTLRGEAVAVDIGEGRTLFALLRSVRDGEWAKNLMFRLSPVIPGTGTERLIATHRAMMANKDLITLPETLPNQGGLIDWPARPMLVTFGDLSDPTSVAEVDPDDLAASFGTGVTLKRITVQMTNDPVTSGIEERLGWFREQARAGGGLIPMIKNSSGRYEAAQGYDESLTDIGLSNFSTEAYEL